MPRVTHFDIEVENVERAKGFYSKVFGWKFDKWAGPMEYWLTMTGENEPGIDGGLSPRSGINPALYLTISVEGIDDYIKKVERNGGKVVRGKMPIPGIGWFAMVQDTEGTQFGMMEDDPEAR